MEGNRGGTVSVEKNDDTTKKDRGKYREHTNKGKTKIGKSGNLTGFCQDRAKFNLGKSR